LRYLGDQGHVEIIDQTRLPGSLHWHALKSLDDFCEAITAMRVRGAPLIGITAAYGLALELRRDAGETARRSAMAQLQATRPTAVNLRWAMDRMEQRLSLVAEDIAAEVALAEAHQIAAQDIEICRSIGDHGLELLQQLAGKTTAPLQIMTHCNAGWLAALRWGTALAPVYRAAEQGLDIHVWVSETRPRNQGASLTAWELGQAGIAHTIIVDNAAGHLMQCGKVDACIVGSDRTLASGDVCNKIGTYLKALAARANDVPFYAAVPTSSIDWDNTNADTVPIEHRSATEVLQMYGTGENGEPGRVALAPEFSQAANPAFDVTPAELVTAIITERGIVTPDQLGQLKRPRD
jgi:methylthioribose-1-phosphate isomerase